MTRDEIFQIERHTDIVKGIIGSVAWGTSVITSNLPAIEAWLRIASLMVGIAVGIVTIRSIVRKK
ncbi:hypothetical protein [Prosthecobacter sp.]|uniref:hypothetical protein n=1 Tax=Prosthecobacter sp. TaxID=1965333 RepID=UPI003783FAAC